VTAGGGGRAEAALQRGNLGGQGADGGVCGGGGRSKEALARTRLPLPIDDRAMADQISDFFKMARA
jgi:hypothetical protein